MVWRLIPVVAHGPGNPGGLSLACSPLGHAYGDVSEVGLVNINRPPAPCVQPTSLEGEACALEWWSQP